MSETLEVELGKLYKASQEKYYYFLLAAAASAIGFAITQLKVEPLQYHHIYLGLSIALWAISFISGMQTLQNAANSTLQNYNYLTFKRELGLYNGEDAAQKIALFKAGVDKMVDKQGKRMAFFGRLQDWSLLLGALVYIVWHGVRMWTNSPLCNP